MRRNKLPHRVQLRQNWGRGGLFLLLLCAGCAPHPAGKTVVISPGPSRDEVGARWFLALDMTPSAPKSYDPMTFTVRATDAAGRPVRGAAVGIALAMPSMDMGRNEVSARETAAGTYVGTGRFTMAGTWRVTVTASNAAGRAMRAFPVEVR